MEHKIEGNQIFNKWCTQDTTKNTLYSSIQKYAVVSRRHGISNTGRYICACNCYICILREICNTVISSYGTNIKAEIIAGER
jgi:endonuclease III